MANFKSIEEYNAHLAKKGVKTAPSTKAIDVTPVEPTTPDSDNTQPVDETVGTETLPALTLEECKTKEDCRAFADANGQKELKFGNRSVDTIKALIAESIKG